MLALDRAQRGSVQFLTFMSQYTVSQPRLAGKQEVYLRIRIGSVDRLSTNKGDLYVFLMSGHDQLGIFGLRSWSIRHLQGQSRVS